VGPALDPGHSLHTGDFRALGGQSSGELPEQLGRERLPEKKGNISC